MTRQQCPTCGHFVKSIFDHIAIDCEHDMTPEQIKELLSTTNQPKETNNERH